MISQSKFDGLAFPVARVRYTEGGWSAQIYRDSDRTYRARVSYDHAVGGGARGALAAALKCWEKARADVDPHAEADTHVAIPGDFSHDAYTFTFVPRELLG